MTTFCWLKKVEPILGSIGLAGTSFNNTLPVGWNISPFVYHLTGLVATNFLRSLGIPCLLYIDDRHNGQLQVDLNCRPYSRLQTMDERNLAAANSAMFLVSYYLVHQHMQEKTSRLSTFAQQVGLKISQKKTEVMMLNVSNPLPVTINGEDLTTTEEFTYLGSTVRHDGGAGSDIKNRLSKARNAFRMLNNVWKSSQYSIKLKLRLYQSCVISTLLYGSECWRMTESDLNKLSTFHTKNLRRILRIFWPETISNQELLARCNQDNMGTIIMRRRWKWIGHVMRREQGNITRTALRWTPEGKRKRGRPKITWRRTVEAELKTFNHTWGSIQRLAQDRHEWLSFVAALHAKPT